MPRKLCTDKQMPPPLLRAAEFTRTANNRRRTAIRRALSRVIVQRGAWLRVLRRSKILAGTMFPINCSLIMVPGDNVWRAS